MDDSTKDDETGEEREQAAATGETPQEAHRAGEYDELRTLLTGLDAKVDALSALMTERALETPATASTQATQPDDETGLVNLEDIDFN